MQGLPLQPFLQALQPAAQFVYTGNPFMSPQYPAIAPMPAQAPPLAQLSAPENHPIFQALVAATSEQVIKKIDERHAPAAAPANLSPENEKILINALKKGVENKWSMERVFQELSQVSASILDGDAATDSGMHSSRSTGTRRRVSAIPNLCPTFRRLG